MEKSRSEPDMAMCGKQSDQKLKTEGEMMSSEMECRAFSDRLINALAYRGHRTYPTGVMRLYNESQNSRSVTVAAVRKWLTGAAIPSQEKLQALAALLDVSPEWLRFGTGSMIAVACPSELGEEERELLDSYRTLDLVHRTALLTYLRRHSYPINKQF
ncbi:helix-turn-helix domain-containing protein [Noviherbaspirillum galbum]|uniref:Helix-turn-helix domain-containing protein n=1 Tax=Noviherbaspirillum galbum TaxID=2709383 RepID=A0A6B3SYC3_9BURK|nr:helix-turn-helix transcriptional regulator [Noviherbaspirillum galbum]NEX63672.1 helix-turn-helix domain-containing protein [Noviherbaspirillum galbum]